MSDHAATTAATAAATAADTSDKLMRRHFRSIFPPSRRARQAKGPDEVPGTDGWRSVHGWLIDAGEKLADTTSSAGPADRFLGQ